MCAITSIFHKYPVTYVSYKLSFKINRVENKRTIYLSACLYAWALHWAKNGKNLDE